MNIPDYALYAAEQLGLDVHEYDRLADLLQDVQKFSRDVADYYATIADRAQADALSPELLSPRSIALVGQDTPEVSDGAG